MSASLAGYRFDGLAEFVSRRGRVRLVEMLLGAGLSSGQIAIEVGVTPRSVRRWLNPRETHPCNENLDRLIELALRTYPNNVHELLLEELTLFAKLISDNFIKK
jgi:predicted transcriptional regulator